MSKHITIISFEKSIAFSNVEDTLFVVSNFDKKNFHSFFEEITMFSFLNPSAPFPNKFPLDSAVKPPSSFLGQPTNSKLKRIVINIFIVYIIETANIALSTAAVIFLISFSEIADDKNQASN